MTLLALISAVLTALAISQRGTIAAARLRRLELRSGGGTPTPTRRRADATRDGAAELAMLLDLLGAALAAGAPLATALDCVDRALPAPRVHPLNRVRDVALSGSLEALTDTDDVPAVLLRALRRSGRSGSRLAVQLRLLADDTRAEAAGAALDRARRVGVLAVLPLGLCCLPAFMLLAVAPLAAGLLHGTLA
jgi:hypothetical protein